MSIFKEIIQEISDQICYQVDHDCDKCPSFISKHCEAEDTEETETKTPNNAPKKDWRKLKEELCNEIGDCDKCPSPISKHCDDARKNMKTGSKAPNDVPQGWIRLITIKGDIYMNTSKIVSLGVPDPATASDGVATVIYTVGAEDDPWYVCDSIETVMEKIKNA